MGSEDEWQTGWGREFQSLGADAPLPYDLNLDTGTEKEWEEEWMARVGQWG